MELTAAARKIHADLKQRLEKLKAKPQPRNLLKKLPGYGSVWVYRRGGEATAEGESDEARTLDVNPSQVTSFVKKLRTRPPPEETIEEGSEIVQGPGFEFPTDKEAAKCVKHWSKRFKQWQPPDGLTAASTEKRPVIRFKPPLPTNEVEVEGKKYRRVESREEMRSLLERGVALIEKCPPSMQDARFYREILKDDYGSMRCRFLVASSNAPIEGMDIKGVLSQYGISEVYAPFPVASKLVSGMKNEYIRQGKTELASGLRVELANRKDDSGDDSTQSHKRRHHQPNTPTTKLDEGDEASVYM